MTLSQIFPLLLVLLILFIYIKRTKSSQNLTNYDAFEVKEKIKDRLNVVLLDVRTIAERKRQSINGSLHIPLQELDRRVSELNKFKDKEIICYCQSGSRSLIAAVKLKKLGFNSANLKGGITKWNLTNA
jgi:rhodanese-related sulfurtransferase